MQHVRDSTLYVLPWGALDDISVSVYTTCIGDNNFDFKLQYRCEPTNRNTNGEYYDDV